MSHPRPLLVSMTHLAMLILFGSFASAAPAAAAPPAANVPEALQPYAAVGSSLAASSRLGEVGWNDEQIEAFLAGVRAGIRGPGYPLDDRAKALFASMSQRLKAIDAERRAKEFAQPGRVEAFMKEACTKFRLQRTDSGLGYGIMEGGAGIRPSPEDTVVFSMSATAEDTETEIPVLTREKMRARVGDLMPGLAEGLQMMTLGSKAMLVLPPALSFGEGSWPEGTVRGTPIFVIVGLHEIISPPVDP
ncbi:MAG: FKBP-type peptidyl-prolyl cis-trans isomerase [Opitutaceae bacterium]|nr:FKBP-type peptidyl-prolyl cis-trans isomerase [Opitutaceae bacterium]